MELTTGLKAVLGAFFRCQVGGRASGDRSGLSLVRPALRWSIMSTSESNYIHGTSSEEQRRLSLMNEFMNEAALHELGLREGDRVVDVGCGLGQLTRGMARACGTTGCVVGIERDERQLEEARRLARRDGEENLAELRAGAVGALPLGEQEWGSFDVAHARFLLEHLSDPLPAVREMVRAVRSGGRVVLQDDDHDVLRLWPEPSGVREIWEAYARTYDRLGNDPKIGRRLVSLLHEAGAKPARNTWIFFGGCAGHPAFASVVANMISILEGARQTVLESNLAKAADYDRALANFVRWGHRPDAAIWYAICWAEGIKP